MKTVPVRIREDHAKRLQNLVGCRPEFKDFKAVHEHVMEMFFDIEGKVYEAALEEMRKKLPKKKDNMTITAPRIEAKTSSHR